jgi:hypothetical protein
MFESVIFAECVCSRKWNRLWTSHLVHRIIQEYLIIENFTKMDRAKKSNEGELITKYKTNSLTFKINVKKV